MLRKPPVFEVLRNLKFVKISDTRKFATREYEALKPKKYKMVRTKKVKSTGRFGVKYGLRVKEKIRLVEEKQRKKQVCPFCSKPSLKRVASSGIWKCKKCGKKFASNAYYV